MITLSPVYLAGELTSGWLEEYQGLRDKVNSKNRPKLNPIERKQLKRILGNTALRDYKNNRPLNVRLLDRQLKDRLRSAARSKLRKTPGAIIGNGQVHHWIPLQFAHLFRHSGKNSFFGLQDPNRHGNLWVIKPADHHLLHKAFNILLSKQLNHRRAATARDILAVARRLESAKGLKGSLVRKNTRNSSISIPEKPLFRQTFFKTAELEGLAF